MAKIESKHPLRWIALLGLGACAAVSSAQGVAASPSWPQHADAKSGADPVVPVIVQTAGALRQWAWGGVHEQVELDRRVDALLFAAAAESGPGDWGDASPVSALVEASLWVSGVDRMGLAVSARQLGWSAPTEAQRVIAVRAELRLLESVVNATAYHAGASEPSSTAQAHSRIHEILANEEYLEVGGLASPTRIRERMGRRLDTLRTGQPLPRFLARDAASNEVRSSLLRGRVTILRFWEQGSQASVLMHEEDARLARRFWDAPVALLGATHSQDREGYLNFVESRSFAGIQVFDGPISTALSDELAKAGSTLAHGAGWSTAVGIFEAWSRPSAGSLFVIDEAGLIRGRDLPHCELETLVSELVAERRARLRLIGESRFIANSSR